MNRHYYCVIMAGGIGSRFWPISRESMPKQFLDFTSSGKSFIRLAYDRVAGIIPAENIFVCSLVKYRDEVLRHIPELPEENLLLEPYSRNTAPCLAFSVYSILKRDPDAVMSIIPADALVSQRDMYQQTMLAAYASSQENDTICTIGVMPTRADANFGYIQISGGKEAQKDGVPVKVKTFTEKPDKELAKVFIDSGEFLWNTGIFVGKADVFREELELYAPEIANLWKGWKEALGSDSEQSFINTVYASVTRNSIDYAIMEKTQRAWTIPASFGWADIGNWESLYGYLADLDENGNASKVGGSSLLKDNRTSIIYSTKKDKLVAIKGLEDFIVVDTDDVLMICPRDENKLKEFIAELAMPEFQDYR